MLLDTLGAKLDTGAALVTYCDDATGERTTLTPVELGEWAARTAGLLRDGCGLVAGDRVLVDAGAAHLQPVTWLLAPLAAGASILLCANLDREGLDRRIAAEGVTHVL